MDHAETRLDGTIAHRALVRYDAYGEMSGSQSTSIALLDATRSGDRALLDPPSRHRAAVRQADPQGSAGARALPGGERGGPACAAAGRRRSRATRRTRRRAEQPMRVGYLGPEGTFTQAAALSAPLARNWSWCPRRRSTTRCWRCTTAPSSGRVVPIENSLEGSVNVTLDALVFEAERRPHHRRDRARRRAVPDRAGGAAARPDRGGDLPSAGHRPMSRVYPLTDCPRRG